MVISQKNPVILMNVEVELALVLTIAMVQGSLRDKNDLWGFSNAV